MTKEEIFDYLLQQDIIVQQGVDNFNLTKFVVNSIDSPEFKLTQPVLELLKNLVKEDILMVIAGQLILTNKYKEILQQGQEPRELKEENIKVDTTTTGISSQFSSFTYVDPLRARYLAQNQGINGDIGDSRWPKELRTADVLTISKILQSICNVPMTISKGGSFYIINNIKMNSVLSHIVRGINPDYKDINPDTFLDMIRTYYKQVDLPMAFKSLFVKEVILGLYRHYEEVGSFRSSSDNKFDNNQNLL